MTYHAYKKLGKLCSINMGQSPESSNYNQNKDGLPFFQGNADFGTLYPVKRMWCNKPTKVADNGDLLISVRAPIGALNFATEECCIGRGLAAISPVSDQVNIKYIFYVLKHKNQELNNKGTGSTFKAINKVILSDTKIPYLQLSEQNNCVSILDKVSNVVVYRKEQLDMLDNLIKSRFVEMFGDPVNNSKGLPEVDFIEVVKLQRGFDLPVQERNQEGNIPVYGSNGILSFHDESKMKGGIITGRSGTIGKVYYSYNEFWPLNTTLFSVETNGNNITFLAYLLEYYKLDRFYDGTGVPTLNRNVVHKQKIINAPIDFQNQFAAFVQQVDKLKVEVQTSLKETQILFDSLMQKYFG